MKRFFFIFFALVLFSFSWQAGFARDVPVATGYLVDQAHVLKSPEIIEERLNSLATQTAYEMGILIVPSLDDETIETYAEKVFRIWGIGSKNNDTGLLLLISIQDRKFKLETGYGVEGIIPDIRAKDLIGTLIPDFQQQDYEAGVNKFLDAVTPILVNNVEYQMEPEVSPKRYSGIFYLGIVLVIWLAGIMGRTKSWWLGGVLGGGISALLVLFGVIAWWSIFPAIAAGLGFDYMVSKNYNKAGKTSWWAGGMWGPGTGGRGFGGGGGFGGFGGGSSGGGGASGGW